MLRVPIIFSSVALVAIDPGRFHAALTLKRAENLWGCECEKGLEV